jgi:predicted Zn-dependent protease
MKRVPYFLILSLLAATLRAEEPALLTEARQARAESVPEVAVQKLRHLLEAKDLSAETQRTANYELAAALFAAEETDEALSVVQPLADSGDVNAQLLEADILAGDARWTDALPIYH